MTVQEQDLLGLLLAGDEEAFAGVVRAWSPAMLRVARAHVRSQATAEEVVQDAWVGVLRGLAGFEGRAQLRTWVFRILVNTARRRGRGEARTMAELSIDHDAGDRSSQPEVGYAAGWGSAREPAALGPEPVVLAAERAAVLGGALAALPDRQRAVVELRDVHGFDAIEVCALLDLTPVNQRVLLHRGRARLRGVLQQAAW